MEGQELAVGMEQGLDALPRTLTVIGAEIREHAARLEYYRRGTLWEAVEIGRRLSEAKAQTQHGEWMDFLQRETGYSASTASRFIRVFDGYGSRQAELLENGQEGNLSTLANLSYSQALELLALPAGERERFAAENNAEDLTVRELREKIRQANRERDEARQALEAERKEQEGTALRIAELESTLDQCQEQMETAQRNAAKAEMDACTAEQSRAEMEKEMRLLKDIHEDAMQELEDLRNRPIDVAVEKVVDEEAIAAARKEERDALEQELSVERFNRQEAVEARKEMAEKLAAAENENKDLRTALGELRKKEKAGEKPPSASAPKADEDMAMFRVLFDQAQGSINQLHGLLLKIEGRGDTATGGKLRNALTALSDAVAQIAKGGAA